MSPAVGALAAPRIGARAPLPGRASRCYMHGMALASKAAIGLGALALIAGGAVLWSQYGGLVYFDMLASAFAGCFL